MKQYLDLLTRIIDEGTEKEDRTGTGTLSVFGAQMRFDLRDGFPLVTTKKVHMKSIIHELIWLISGDTNIKYLNDNGVKIWDEWADEEGALGPIYGEQWRNWGHWEPEFTANVQEPFMGMRRKKVDQLANAIDLLRNNPDSRRIIVSAWNAADLDQMALHPCHMMFQYNTCPMDRQERLNEAYKIIPQDEWASNTGVPYPYEDGELDDLLIPSRWLDLQMFQRSTDSLLGLPFNIASYSLLLMMTAQVVNMVPRDFVWTGGDTHIYRNHFKGALTQLEREPMSLPSMTIRPRAELWNYKYEDFSLEGYQSHPHIKFEVAV